MRTLGLHELLEIADMLRVVGKGQRKGHRWCYHMMRCAACGLSTLDIYRHGTLRCSFWKMKFPRRKR